MLPTPARPAIGAVAAALAVTLAGCAKQATPTTNLGQIAGPSLSAAPGAGTNHGPGTSASPTPGVTRSKPKPSTQHSTGSHPPSAPPSSAKTWPVLTNEDCLGYNPATISLVDGGAGTWIVSDGSSNMLILANASDASLAEGLTQSYSQQCYIGRDTTRTGNDRYRHIVEYWKGTGVPGASLPPGDCTAYDKNLVTAQNIGADGWQISAGPVNLVLADSQADATNAVALAHKYGRLCLIGRNNTQTWPAEYIVEYWLP